MKKTYIFAFLSLFFANTAVIAASDEEAVYFSKDWCPHLADLHELDKHMIRIMDGCCISSSFLFAETKKNPKALLPWRKRMRATPQNSECVGTLSATPDVNISPEELEKLIHEDSGRQAREIHEQQKEQQEAERQKKEAFNEFVGALRKADRAEFCGVYGRGIRGESVPDVMSAIQFKNLVKKEAIRRKLSFNDRRVLREEISIGMSQCQMYASWGMPDEENRTVGSWGVHIQHVYGDFGPYVYTENGRVTSYQN